MSIVKEGYLRHYINGSWEDRLAKLYSSGKFELVTLLPSTVTCATLPLGPLAVATNPKMTTAMMWSGFAHVFAIKINPDAETELLLGVEQSQERRRWVEMINFTTLRNALELKHPHPLTEVIITNQKVYLQKILTTSVLAANSRIMVCNNCQSIARNEAFLCEFCGDYVLCSTCHKGFKELTSPFVETPHHPFPLVDQIMARSRFSHNNSALIYTCNICSKDCSKDPIRCIECDGYAECRACVAARTKPASNDSSLDIQLEPKLLSSVLLIEENTFALNKERLHKCPRAASLISNRPWDLFTIDIIPASFAYFEVTFNKLNDKEGKVSVGIGNQIFVQNQMLGYQQNSFGYCCDGHVSQNAKQNIEQFYTYSEGDTIGAGILLDSYNQRKIYFTRNGQLVGTYRERIHEGMDCFPGVSFMKGSEAEFAVNMTGPFKFNVSTIPDYRRDQTAYFSLLPPEVSLQCLCLAAISHRQTLELRLVNKQMSSLVLENDIWKSLYLKLYPNQNKNLKIKSWHTMYKRRYKAEQGKWNSSGIENCDMEFKCPLLWENLTSTSDSASTRTCNKCRKTVYKAESFKDLEEFVKMGRCVSLQLPRWGGLMGQAYIGPPPDIPVIIPPPFPQHEDLLLPEDYDDDL